MFDAEFLDILIFVKFLLNFKKLKLMSTQRLQLIYNYKKSGYLKIISVAKLYIYTYIEVSIYEEISLALPLNDI